MTGAGARKGPTEGNPANKLGAVGHGLGPETAWARKRGARMGPCLIDLRRRPEGRTGLLINYFFNFPDINYVIQYERTHLRDGMGERR